MSIKTSLIKGTIVRPPSPITEVSSTPKIDYIGVINNILALDPNNRINVNSLLYKLSLKQWFSQIKGTKDRKPLPSWFCGFPGAPSVFVDINGGPYFLQSSQITTPPSITIDLSGYQNFEPTSISLDFNTISSILCADDICLDYGLPGSFGYSYCSGSIVELETTIDWSNAFYSVLTTVRGVETGDEGENNDGGPNGPYDPNTPPPAGGTWKCSMFFPHQICGTNQTPVWEGNSGVDSNMGYASDHGNSWENEKRINGFKWVQAYGGDTTMFIADSLYGQTELQMFLTNREHPDKPGYRLSGNDNWVLRAKTFGINRWVISLFNDGPSDALDNREDYIKEMCECYKWATETEVAFLICLEANEILSVGEVKQIVSLLKQYSGGKRIIVGSANSGFLKSCSGNGVELWAECDEFPFDISMSTADAYLSKLANLSTFGRVWAGEWGAGQSGEVDKYITQKALAAGYDMGCGYFK